MNLKEIENLLCNYEGFQERKKIYDISNFKKSRVLGEKYFSFNVRLMSIELIAFFQDNTIIYHIYSLLIK